MMTNLLAYTLPNMSKFKLRFLILLFFPFFVFSVPAVFAHSQTQVIEITEEGFIPAEVTIDTNSTVFFLNKDKMSHWPASNPHPTHDLYPEFDPQLPIENGKSWAFKPRKEGEWKYHDHLNPHRGGVLKVLAEEKTPGLQSSYPPNWMQNLKIRLIKFLSQIKSLYTPKFKIDPQRFAKVSSQEQIIQLKKFADSNGAQNTWQFIKDTYKSQGGSSGNIHDLAHLSGGLLFEKLDFNGITKCSAEFAFGCFHGFLDKAFAKNLDHLLDAEDACSKLGPDGSLPPKASLAISGPVASCIHGIGHGVASFYSSSDLQKSLLSCRKLITGQEYCFDGVFMEFVRSAPDSFYKKDDFLYPCNALEQKFGPAYSISCGRNQPSLLMGRFKLDFEEVTKICVSSDSTLFKQACFDSLGFSLVSSGDTGQIISSCQKIGEEKFMLRCIKAAAGELVFQDVPQWDEKSKAVCNSLTDTKECLAYVERLTADYHRVRH